MMTKYMKELRATINFLQAVRKHIEEDATGKELLTLLGITVEPGIDQSTLGIRLNLTRSGVSKDIADLSVLTSRKQPGPGLVENTIDPMRMNIRLPMLTRKGEAAMTKVCEAAWGPK
jgi:DNA-binding MarR family transcriptional regulator